ncbi:uncharacterized protein PSFLO_07254 [Pseudozyma flocculosa]|uniref:Uncharacterized protein n=1 Tax=Pseudozyma flocculosa TaxID=84751 RepID=A0A5C3FBK8_9BASI|nr:uncharacterized protein PSFLO_07254 [Pseudozyma flocculosa]
MDERATRMHQGLSRRGRGTGSEGPKSKQQVKAAGGSRGLHGCGQLTACIRLLAAFPPHICSAPLLLFDCRRANSTLEASLALVASPAHTSTSAVASPHAVAAVQDDPPPPPPLVSSRPRVGTVQVPQRGAAALLAAVPALISSAQHLPRFPPISLPIDGVEDSRSVLQQKPLPGPRFDAGPKKRYTPTYTPCLAALRPIRCPVDRTSASLLGAAGGWVSMRIQICLSSVHGSKIIDRPHRRPPTTAVAPVTVSSSASAADSSAKRWGATAAAAAAAAANAVARSALYRTVSTLLSHDRTDTYRDIPSTTGPCSPRSTGIPPPRSGGRRKRSSHSTVGSDWIRSHGRSAAATWSEYGGDCGVVGAIAGDQNEAEAGDTPVPVKRHQTGLRCVTRDPAKADGALLP